MMQYAKIEAQEGELPRSGVWPLVGSKTVVAPCGCCNDWGVYVCQPSQIISVSKKAPPGVIHGGKRSDGYHFFLFKKGKSVVVRAGCRNFSLRQARKHWGEDYCDERLGRWSLKTVAAMEKKAIQRGWIKRKR
jgi:hypothetical protein